MKKRWLYSVAVGALLMAGNATGITVHEVLSHDFFSTDAEQRLTTEQLKETGEYRGRPKLKHKYGKYAEDIYIIRENYKGKTAGNARWKTKQKSIWSDDWTYTSLDYSKETTTVQHALNKEKTIRNITGLEQKDLETRVFMGFNETNQFVYTNKARKNARPVGPYAIVDNSYVNNLTNSVWVSAQLLGEECNTTTNIVSDNEAYITTTLRQTGHIDDFTRHYYPSATYDVNEDSSLWRTYTKHITTDADHVYITQEAKETTHHDHMMLDGTKTWQTDYVATFKNGILKGEKETVSYIAKRKPSSWLSRWLEDQHY